MIGVIMTTLSKSWDVGDDRSKSSRLQIFGLQSSKRSKASGVEKKVDWDRESVVGRW